MLERSVGIDDLEWSGRTGLAVPELMCGVHARFIALHDRTRDRPGTLQVGQRYDQDKCKN